MIRTIRARLSEVAPFFVSVPILAVLWELISRIYEPRALPPLSTIAVSVWEFLASGELLDPLGTSMATFGIGMAISIVVGLVVGTAMGASRVADVYFGVFVNAGLAAPVVAFVPLFMLLFGIGRETRVASVVIFALWVVIVNVRTGVRSVDQTLVQMARSFGAGPWNTIRQVRIPAAVPYLLAGLRIGTARGVKGLIVGEVLVSIGGLGGLIHRYGSVFALERLFALVFLLAIFSLAAVQLVEWLTGLMLPPGSMAIEKADR